MLFVMNCIALRWFNLHFNCDLGLFFKNIQGVGGFGEGGDNVKILGLFSPVSVAHPLNKAHDTDTLFFYFNNLPTFFFPFHEIFILPLCFHNSLPLLPQVPPQPQLCIFFKHLFTFSSTNIVLPSILVLCCVCEVLHSRCILQGNKFQLNIS